MADEVDVENGIVAAINAAIYPGGPGTLSAAGVRVDIFRGWPTPIQQEDAKAQSYVNISVATRNGVEKALGSRYPRQWQTSVQPAHTLTATAAGSIITIGGTIATPQNVMVLIGPRGGSFSYAVQPGDTLTSIASGLATLMAAQYPGTTSSGSTITVANPNGIVTARVASTGTSLKEVKRQDKSFQIMVWAPPSPNAGDDADALRTAVIKVIDPALAALTFLSFPDGSSGFIRYERTITLDLAQEEGLYRRDLFYWVEYPTVLTETDYEIGAAQLGSAVGKTMPPENAAITTNI